MIDVTEEFGGSAWLELLDATGRPVMVQRASLGTGRNTLEMDLSGLTSGTYLLCLKQTDGTIVQRTSVVKY